MIQQMAARSNIQTLISQWHTDPFLLGPFGWAQTGAWMHTLATKRGDEKRDMGCAVVLSRSGSSFLNHCWKKKPDHAIANVHVARAALWRGARRTRPNRLDYAWRSTTSILLQLQ
jgi:hypothetical protein